MRLHPSAQHPGLHFCHRSSYIMIKCSFSKKKYLLHFNVKTSSAHEGTNFGIKEHVAAVLPSQRINAAAKYLSLQSSILQPPVVLGRSLGHCTLSSISSSSSCCSSKKFVPAAAAGLLPVAAVLLGAWQFDNMCH